MKTFEQFSQDEPEGIPLMKYFNWKLDEEYFYISGNDICLKDIIDDDDYYDKWQLIPDTHGKFNIENINDDMDGILSHYGIDSDVYTREDDKEEAKKYYKFFKKLIDVLNDFDEKDYDIFVEGEDLGLL